MLPNSVITVYCVFSLKKCVNLLLICNVDLNEEKKYILIKKNFTFSQIRKPGSQKIRDFQTSEFSITLDQSPRFPNIRLLDIPLVANYENLDHKNPRFRIQLS